MYGSEVALPPIAWGADETISVKPRYENLEALTQASLAIID